MEKKILVNSIPHQFRKPFCKILKRLRGIVNPAKYLIMCITLNTSVIPVKSMGQSITLFAGVLQCFAE